MHFHSSDAAYENVCWNMCATGDETAHTESHDVNVGLCFFSRLFLSIYKWKTNSLKSVEFWKLLEFMSLTSNKVNSIKTNAAYDARYIQFCRERVHRKSGIMCHFCVDSTNTKTLSIVCMRNVNETEKQRTRNASGMNDDNDNNWKKIGWNCISLDLKCSFEGNLIS